MGKSDIDDQPTMENLKWSQGEKSLARKVFDLALLREFQATIQETKKRAEEVEQPSDLWELEHFLTERRKEIDRTYDYRYSALPMVFGLLIRKGRLKEEDLQGLGKDKLKFILGVAKM